MTDRLIIVVSYIKENFPEAADIDENTSLIDSNLLDSMGVVDIISFIEERFGIVVADDEITPDNFGSAAQIVAYLARKGA